MNQKNNIIWVVLVIFSYLGLSYLPVFGWGISFLGSIFIIIFGYKAWPKNFKQKLGILETLSQYLYSFLLLMIFSIFTFFFISYLSELNNYGFAIGNIYNLIHICFYTLNEELILGGLVLLFLKNKFKRKNPIYISLLVALVFSVMHYTFYRWIFQGDAQGVLSSMSLLSLFLVGVIRNNLILKFGHIGYSWALHFSWMAIMFGCSIYDQTSKVSLTQTERFNSLIGNEITIGASIVLVIITTTIISKSKYKINNENVSAIL